MKLNTSIFSEFLIEEGFLNQLQVTEAIEFQSSFGGSLCEAATKVGLAREIDMVSAQSKYLDLPILDRKSSIFPKTADIERALEQLDLTSDWLSRNGLIIWLQAETRQKTRAAKTGDRVTSHSDTPTETLCVARCNPFDGGVDEELFRRWSSPMSFWIIGPRLLETVLTELNVNDNTENDIQDSKDLSRLRQLAEEAPVIAFVNGLFSEALEVNASDVHIEPKTDGFSTRLRVDGVLGHERDHPKSTFDSVITRLKILSGMDIAERRLPQDGRQTIRVAGEEVDLRVSSLPATEGESVVIRLLRKKSELPDMEGLGLRGKTIADFKRLIELPNGVFLVTGPTGSGKSTTLYRALEHLNDGASKLITIEDPVEYDINGINQVQARPDIGLNFAAGLRSMLRQDPDVIMVGEIRDKETAEVAIQAALTGHLVLSTLHTNSAQGSVERLIDLGVEPFLISAALRGVLGQRLLRRLCVNCKTPEKTSGLFEMVSDLVPENTRGGEIVENHFHQATGCVKCSGSGYKGRIGVYELMDIQGMQSMGMSGSATELAKTSALNVAGFRSMLQDSLLKASKGETSMSELERVFGKLGNK